MLYIGLMVVVVMICFITAECQNECKYGPIGYILFIFNEFLPSYVTVSDIITYNRVAMPMTV